MAGQSAIDERWVSSEGAGPPQLPDILAHIHQFLELVGYKKTSSALAKELARNDIALYTTVPEPKNIQLLQLYQQWHLSHQRHLTLSAPTDASAGASGSDDTSSDGSSDDDDSGEESERDEAEGVLVDVEAEETSNDDSDEDSESTEDLSDSDSDDNSNSSDEVSDASSASPTRAGDKRKRASSSDSSSEDSASDLSSSGSINSSDDDSSDDEDARPAKRVKRESIDSRSMSDDSSGSDSSSDADSDEDGSISSDGSSSSDSSSDDDAAERLARPPEKVKKTKKQQPVAADENPQIDDAGVQSRDAESQSSVTLDVESPADTDTPGQMHPDRLKRLPADKRVVGKKEIAELKKQGHVPFSRIPADQKVDPRFASNAYVSYDYADRAHRDLIVTKGKGFTKEKNKKKRGAYRGGAIDLTPKGIKFDD